MESQKQRTEPRFKKSVIVAFHKLLKAARDGSEVLLLDMRDCHANPGLQSYNDDNAAEDHVFEGEYGQFVDHLAEVFDLYAKSNGTGQPKMPSKSQLDISEQLLSSLMRRSQ